METLPNSKIVYFDVDDTLILWNGPSWEPNPWAIDNLKRFFQTGYTIVVWSQSGGDWAETICKELELEDYVSLCISKPLYVVDDKYPEEWLMQTIEVK